jgi:hypothetical protein
MSARVKRRRPIAATVTPVIEHHDALVEQYAAMAHAFEHRPVDHLLRALDVAIAGAAAVLSAPLSLLIAAVLKLASPRGPVLYRGWRVGRGGHLFQMLKFRTLAPDAEARLGPFLGPELTQLTQNEVTPFGRAAADPAHVLRRAVRGDPAVLAAAGREAGRHRPGPAPAHARDDLGREARPRHGVHSRPIGGSVSVGHLDDGVADRRAAREPSRGDQPAALRPAGDVRYLR